MKRFVYIFIVISVICQSFGSARSEDSDSPEYLIEENRLDDAEKILDGWIASDGKDVYAMSLKADVCRRKGQYRKAMKILEKAEKTDDLDPTPNFYLGKLYFAMQDFDNSAAQFRLFMEKMTPLLTDEDMRQYYVDNLHDIALMYFGLKRYDDLYPVLVEILKLFPKDTTALYNLGLYYYYSEHNRSKAYTYLKSVIDIDPKGGLVPKAKYAMEFIRANPDPRFAPDDSFIDQEYND